MDLLYTSLCVGVGGKGGKEKQRVNFKALSLVQALSRFSYFQCSCFCTLGSLP